MLFNSKFSDENNDEFCVSSNRAHARACACVFPVYITQYIVQIIKRRHTRMRMRQLISPNDYTAYSV